MNINITELAANEGSALVERLRKDLPEIIGIRLGIKGGGCSGFQYEISQVLEEPEGDFLFERGEFKIYVDPISMAYLDGAIVDWNVGIQGSSLVIKNPNSTTTCGCGSSFS